MHTEKKKKEEIFPKDELEFWIKTCAHMLDDLDVKIYMLLRENGRMTDKEIAEKLGVSPSTVRRRRISMEEHGILKIIGVLIYQKTLLSYADVLVKFRAEATKEEIESFLEEAMKSFNIFEIAKYIGQYDLLLRFVDRNLESLKDRISSFLQRPFIESYLILPICRSPKAFDIRLENNKK